MTTIPTVEAQTVDALLRQSAVARAASLARSGHYAEAETALGTSGTRDLAALDLLARIRAQQGRFAEAQSLWAEALRRDPLNPVYAIALKRLAGGRSSLVGFWLRWPLAVLLLLLIIGGTSVWLRSVWRQELTALVVEPGRAITLARPAELSKLDLAVAGVTQNTDGTEFVLRFDHGLFTGKSSIAPDATHLLKDLGQHLEPYEHQIEIRIIGYCDNLPLSKGTRYPDERALALARSDAVARYLAANTTLPLSIFTLQAGAGSLFPNDTTSNRARNRTVELRISYRPK